MKRRQAGEEQRPFVERVQTLEAKMFPGEFGDGKMMKSERSFWQFRPSHHASTGLVTAEDIELLKQPGKCLLSVGAHPAFLERLLPELGVPVEHMLIADKEQGIVQAAGTIPSVTFDMLGDWPDLGMFDRIIFPESLCIAVSDKMREEGLVPSDDHASDPREAELLVLVLKQALKRLRPGGVLRANGPMSHPNVVRATGIQGIDYDRFFLTIRSPG
jgi:hypothetical protein